MGAFFTYFFAAIAFVAMSAFGWLWFRGCEWDEEFNCRNYKMLALFIPASFFLVFGVVRTPRSLLPPPSVSGSALGPSEIQFPVKGTPGKKRKKAKKQKVEVSPSDEDTVETQNSPPSEDEP